MNLFPKKEKRVTAVASRVTGAEDGKQDFALYTFVSFEF